jgi:hypothetical protein
MTPSTVWKFCGLLVGVAVLVLWFYPDPQGATLFQRSFLASIAVIVAVVVGVVVWARGRGAWS